MGGHMCVGIYEGDVGRVDELSVCPFHKGCVEGFVASRGLAARFGVERRELESVSDDHQGWDAVAFYLAQLVVNSTLLLSPARVVLGGGVFNRKVLYPKVRATVLSLLNDYLAVDEITHSIDEYIVPPLLDAPGLVGAALVGAAAVEASASPPSVQG